jgi:eukaryotic-like serine/threonine-protein kinase
MSTRRSTDESDAAVAASGFGVGTLLDGKYRLERALGTGGMGSVFRAHHDALDVDVAIKVVRADVEKIAQLPLADRLLQEARAAAQLGHPAIARVFDFGVTPSGDPYLVMELLQGEDLARIIKRRGTIKPGKAVQTILPIAHGLATAHEKGIVHRDVKPENIFLAKTDSGTIQPKLIDFGVARLERTAAERITLVGYLLGSPGYMSPEQARGEDVGAPADTWGLLVVLYELLTGRLPFQADNYNALLRTIVEDPHPSILALGVDDAELAAIVDRGLAKRMEQRYGSMAELGTALAHWLVRRGYSVDICGNSLSQSWLARKHTGRPIDIFESVPPPSWPTPLSLPPSELSLRPMDCRLPLPARLPSFETPATRTSIPVAVPTSGVRERETSPGAGRRWRQLVTAGLCAAVAGVAVGWVVNHNAVSGGASAAPAAGPPETAVEQTAGEASPPALPAPIPSALEPSGTDIAAAKVPPAATAEPRDAGAADGAAPAQRLTPKK